MDELFLISQRHAARFLRRLIALDRRLKRAFVMAADAVACVVAVWLAFSLRLGVWHFFTSEVLLFMAATLALFPPIFLAMGVYRTIFRFAGSGTVVQLLQAVFLLALPLIALFTFLSYPGIPRTIAILHPILFLGLLVLLRISGRYLLVDLASGPGIRSKLNRALIYGAGTAGRQLAVSLQQDPHFELVGFVDDDERLDRQRLDSTLVHSSARLPDLVERYAVDTIFLAMPTLARSERNRIINDIRSLKVHVLTLPSMQELVDGEVSISDVREIKVEDLLGRDAIVPNEVLLGRTIVGKTVLITGAGGSIGSELSRQVARLHPARLILADMAEPALYEIERELRNSAASEASCQFVPELMNLTDRAATARLFARWRPDTVFHAAAYKHVPMVECNVLSGLRNNVLGTRNAALAAQEFGVSHFILISTDKAVRPTNVMGASKRVCELILQVAAQSPGRTNFAMVRFGNVLGSSGSVVPQFEKQIREGGPVTLTHRDITRFFMTIPEAAQLVIQAGALAQGGEVFLLDMGKPVKILELAQSMIELAGLEIKDESNPHGDIEIVEIGLRPGEKLYEELLIDERAEATHHPRIMKANETCIAASELESQLSALEEAIENGDAAAALACLRRLVPEYKATQNSSQTLPASA
jgi:FlaA1/EpsC-like NDP-sugar epimerase